jgi:hypothetical protein
VPEDGARGGASRAKARKAQLVSETGEQQVHGPACHMRPDGHFFFLDVPGGRYVLNEVDAGGAIVRTSEVTLVNWDPMAKMPVVTLEFGIAEPQKRR